MLYDASDYESFLRLRSTSFDMLTRKLSPDCIVYILGNKLDIEPKAVSFDEGSDFALSKGALFSEVSGLTRRNVGMLVKMMVSKSSQFIGTLSEDRIKPYLELPPRNDTAQ